MRTLPRTFLRYCAIAACAVVVANGCRLDRSIPVYWSDVQPRESCPGDTLTASYDFLGGETCPADASCSTFFPRIITTSAPTSFPARTTRAFSDSFTFVPAADTVNVTFDTDRETVTVPTSRFEAGERVFAQRLQIRDATHIARRIGVLERTLDHGGMCNGSTPAHAAVELPGPPQVSASARLQQLCNANGVTVTVILSGSPTGTVHTQALAPGECIDASVPGVPPGIHGARLVEVRPQFFDPGVHCSATGPNTPPASLRTLARMGCG